MTKLENLKLWWNSKFFFTKLKKKCWPKYLKKKTFITQKTAITQQKKCDQIRKNIKLWPKFKQKIVTKQKKYCDQTKNKMVTKFENSNCDKT